MTERENPPIAGKALSRALTRRCLLTGITAGAALLVGNRVADAACLLTPAQTEGPFYPVAIGEDDWDLTRVRGGTGRAEGEVIEVLGQVLDARCRPLVGRVVEVWQANAHGVYDHPRDRSRGRPKDPNFQGYARLRTDDNGHYRFLTIVPGAYPATASWTRPPHIHFKVHPPSGRPLTTQVYFSGDPLNAKDHILGRLSPAQRESVMVDFSQRRADGVRRGTFNPVVAVG